MVNLSNKLDVLRCGIDPAAHHTLPMRIVLTYFQRSREEQRGGHVRPADTTWCDLEETYVARELVAFYSRSGDINYAGDGVATLSALCYIRRAHNSGVLDSNPVPATMNLELGGLTTFELFVTVTVPQDCEKLQKFCYRVTENSES